jgi:hypothetical protein
MGHYDFTATDEAGAPLGAAITCTWEPDPSLEDTAQVNWTMENVDPSNIDEDIMCANPFVLVTTGPVTIDTDAGTISGVGAGDIEFNVYSQGLVPIEIGVFSFHAIHFTDDVTVVGSRALVLLSCTDVTVEGVIDACASFMTAGSGGFNGGPCETDGEGIALIGSGGNAVIGDDESPWHQPGGGGGAFGGDGGDGGDASSSSGGAGGNQLLMTETLIPLLGGSGGGGGACRSEGSGGDGGQGGGGGGAVQISANLTIWIEPGFGIHACGAGGTGPTSDGCAGGGGGAGGGILLEAPYVAVDGILAANGGGGGGGDNWDDGNPGDFNTMLGEDGHFGSTQADGGDGIDGGGDGGDGGAGSIADGEVGGSDTRAGGGGGGVGVIRINTRSGAADISGVVSPDAASGEFTQGTVQVW